MKSNKESSWQLVVGSSATAQENMERDALALEALSDYSSPTLYLYSWRGKCATFGHFCRVEEWVDLKRAKEAGWEFARRPTGGGITFHTHDLAFSLLVPAHHIAYRLATQERYLFVHQALQRALGRCSVFSDLFEHSDHSFDGSAPFDHFCSAKATRFDLVVEGKKKLVGAAQRCTKRGFLHQGSLFLHPLPLEELFSFLTTDERLLAAIKAQSTSLASLSPSAVFPSRSELQQELMPLFVEELTRGGT